VTRRWILGLWKASQLEQVRRKRGPNELNSRFGVWLSVLLLLTGDFSSNNEFPDIVFLAQVEELSDLRGPLWSEPLWEDVLGESGNALLALLDNDEGKDGNIGTDDAATDTLAFALAGTTNAIARVTVSEEQAYTVGQQDTLLHREALLVVSTSDTEDVSLPLVAERVTWDLLRHALFVEMAAVTGAN
jgi:hypothetical protein